MNNIKVKIKRIDLGEDGCHIFCKGKIHHKKVRILIDTGASKSVISTHFAELLDDLEYIELPENETAGIGPEKVESQFARIEVLKLGKMIITDLVVGVMDLEHVKVMYEKFGHKAFDAILGGDVLHERSALIDYKFKQLVFRVD